MAEYKQKTFYERAMARQSEMETDRVEWDSSREEIVELFRPDITRYSLNSSERGKFLHEIVESTGAWSAGVMARGFTGSLVGPTLKWLRSRFSEMAYQGNDALNAFLQRFDDYMLEQVFRRSNFYEIIGPDVLDGITMGSPVMLCEEKESEDRIVCKLPHYKENYLKRDWFGNDIAYHRLFEVTAMNAASIFNNKALPDTVQESLRLGNHKEKHKYLMICYHKDDLIFKDLPEHTGEKVGGIDYRPTPIRPWCLYYLPYACADERYQGVLKYGIPGYFHKPFNAWHYFRNPHETYARTPAWAAIYDEKGGQSAWTAYYEVGEGQARPAMIAMQEMQARIKSSPGGYTWAISDAEYDRPPKALERGNANYSYWADFIDRVDEKRKRHFHIDLFRLLDEYHREHKQPPTAFEVAQMLAEKNVQIGPAIESFDRGLLAPIYDRFVEIELRSGRLLRQTDPPDELFETDGRLIAQLVGPLAQAQKLSVMMRRVQDSLGMAAPVFEIWPDSKNKIKPDILLERLLEESDFYQDAIASKEEYDEIIASLTMMRQQQMNLENLESIANSASKLQKSSEEGSPLKMLEGAAA